MEIQKTGLISDTKMLLHKSKRKHPERPQRLLSILKSLEAQLYTNHPFVDYISSIERIATEQQLKLAHKGKYIKHVKSLWPTTSHRSDIMVLDTYFNQHTDQCSKMAVGGVLSAVDKIVQGNWRNGFALVRPPGHHSGGRNTINGFCIFNNVAIAAKYLQQKHKKCRIAIVDWDVHHGDGTQHIFQDNKDILMISIHRYDRGTFYPSSQEGHVSNMGTGWALGTKVNISLNFVDEKFKEYPFQSPGDNQYVYIYHRIIEPILKEFDPQFILVSSGFDAARNDPLGGFSVTPNGYYYMTKKLTQLQKPLLVVLQGGYNLVSISQSACAVMKALLGEEGLPEKIDVDEKKMKHLCQINPIIHEQIDKIITVLSAHWHCLLGDSLKQYTEGIKTNKVRVYGTVSDEESSSSSSSSDQQQTQPQNPYKPKKTKSLHKHKITQSHKIKKQQQQTQSSVTSQFYFAAGHLQRFKNFSPNNQKVFKLTHQEQIQFYETMTLQKKFIPKYYGRQGKYIIIQNLLFEQIDPVVIDIKLSRQSQNPVLTEERMMKQKKKQIKTTSEKFGFRVSGYTTPTYKEGGILVKSEHLVRKILKHAVDESNRQLFITYLKDLSKILNSLQKKYYGTSIILIKGKNKSQIRWVDFHYWQKSEDDQIDTSLIEGINNLRKFIEELKLGEQEK